MDTFRLLLFHNLHIKNGSGHTTRLELRRPPVGRGDGRLARRAARGRAAPARGLALVLEVRHISTVAGRAGGGHIGGREVLGPGAEGSSIRPDRGPDTRTDTH